MTKRLNGPSSQIDAVAIIELVRRVEATVVITEFENNA